MPASRFLRVAPVAAATLLLGWASSATAEDGRVPVKNLGALPLVSDGAPAEQRSLAERSLLGRSAFSATGNAQTPLQHGGSASHLPPTSQNIEVVSKLEMQTPADRRTPETAGIPTLPGQIADLAVYKGYAYLNSWNEPTCRRGGTFIVDIQNPAAPQQVGFLPALADRYHGEGAHVVTLDTPAFKGDLLAVNNEPYSSGCVTDLAHNGGFDLYDVTNPRAPRTFVQGIGDTNNEDGGGLVGDEETPNSSHSVWVWQGADRRAYIVFVDNIEFTDVDIYEITDPANPRPVGEFDLVALAEEQGYDIEDDLALGNTVLHHDTFVKQINGRSIMMANYWDAGYVTLDVTNPANPRYIADTSFDGSDPLTGFDPPEGNGHQGELSHDNRYLLAADEDFGAYRFDARITDGPNEDTLLSATQGSDVPQVGPDNDLVGDTKFVGEACTAASVDPSGGTPIALIARGTCTFQEKYDAVVAAGYEAGIVFNSNSTTDGCETLLSMLVEGDDIPFLFVPRFQGFQIMEAYDEATYECTPGDNANTTPNPAAPRDSASVAFVAQFDGWGYAHLYEANVDPNTSDDRRKMRRIDSYAIEESLNPDYASGFGDLSIHEFATDPTENVAYSSYYAGGMRVFTFGPGGLTEQGKYIDQDGNNFWGVEQFTSGGERYFAGSDRDFGLYVFKYTGPGAAQRPVCTNSMTMVPFMGSATVALPCSDANGNPLTRAISSAPAAGTLSGDANSGAVGYAQRAGTVGSTDSFTFTANDGAATSAAATATLVTVARDGGACFNRYVGTPAKENLTGSSFGDHLRGAGGADTVRGLGGVDCLFGGSGRDQLLGDVANDRLYGGSGQDRMFGDSGRDRLYGGRASDNVRGSSGNDRIRGGKGADKLDGGSNNDRVHGDVGDDRLRGGPGRDRLFGGEGDDRLEAGDARLNRLSGGSGDDRVMAVNGKRDIVRCGGGRDRVRADPQDRVAGSCEAVRRARPTRG